MVSGDRKRIDVHGEDLHLARSVTGGSIPAWHRFLEVYGSLIYRVILRHLPAEDDDDVRSLYVDVLEAFYNDDLGKYSGRISLRSWIALVTRRRSVDYIRNRYGRHRAPKALERLSEFDRDVFQMFFVERLPFEIVAQMLEWKGHHVSIDAVVESIQRVEDVLGQRFLAQVEERFFAKRNGNGTAAALRYVVDMRVEYENRIRNDIPDRTLLERESAKRLERVRKLVAQLSDEERQVVQLRFEEGLSAVEISRRLQLDGPRRVYTVVERVLRRLRVAMDGV